MHIYQEPIHYQNPQLCLKVWQFAAAGEVDPTHQLQWHYHKEIEFVLVLDGVHEIHTPSQNYVLHPGEVMVLGSSQLHRGVTRKGQYVNYIVLHVDLEPYFDAAMMNYMGYFMEVLKPLDELNDILMRNKSLQEEIGAIMRLIHDEVMGKEKGYEIAVSMHIKHLMLALLRHDDRNVLAAHQQVDASVIKPVIQYIDNHLDGKVDMAEVSKIAGMSYVYFSRYFKKKTGVSFTEYVNRKRIATAKRLLVMSDRTVSDIASSVGLDNMAHFYELFKRFNGCTPKQFRDRMLN